MKKSKLRFLTCLAVCVLCMSAFSVTAFAGGGPEFEETEPSETVSEPESGEPLSEETDIVTRDLLYDKATNKQFITIEDRDGNIFYLVIDYDAPVNEDEEQFKTYFLNPVDTDDLAALAEEEETAPVVCTCSEKCVAGAVNTNCPVCATNMTECAGKETKPAEPEPEPTTEPEPEPEKSNSAAGLLVLLLIAALGGGGAFAYIKFIKNKPKTKTSPDLDDYDFEDENDEEDAEMPEDELDEEDDEDGTGSEGK